tara:strand:+ start:3307 stop:3759 length:453 start_codon:yes stop_codon:yes gene_type:complete
MAGNLKQRLIKAGRDFNYAEGVKVLNGETTDTIAAGTIVYASGFSGPFLTVKIASNTNKTGRLHVAKHDIPAGEYGVCLPWKLLTGLNNQVGVVGGASGASLGAAVYLGANGAFTASSASSARKVGVVVSAATGPATTDGAILFCGEGNG